MTRSDWLLILQGAGQAAQLINAQIAVLTHNAALALLIGAVLAGFSYVVQHLGNQTVPDPPKPKP